MWIFLCNRSEIISCYSDTFIFGKNVLQESILSEPDNFLAWKCDDLDLSKNNKYRSCSYDGGDLVPMGEQVTTKGNPTGIYYLHTTGIDGNYSCNDQDSCFA